MKKATSVTVKMTDAQRAILALIAEHERMDSSAFIRDLIAHYCEDRDLMIPWPEMPGKGGDYRSATWRVSRPITRSCIASREGDQIIVAPLTAENAAVAVEMGYSAQIPVEQAQVYLLGDDWSHEDIERVRAMVRMREEE